MSTGDSTNASVDWPLPLHQSARCFKSCCDAAPDTCSTAPALVDCDRVKESGSVDFHRSDSEFDQVEIMASKNSSDIVVRRTSPLHWLRTYLLHWVTASSVDDGGRNDSVKVRVRLLLPSSPA